MLRRTRGLATAAGAQEVKLGTTFEGRCKTDRKPEKRKEEGRVSRVRYAVVQHCRMVVHAPTCDMTAVYGAMVRGNVCICMTIQRKGHHLSADDGKGKGHGAAADHGSPDEASSADPVAGAHPEGMALNCVAASSNGMAI